jgi:putative ABC transport system permease protein
LIGIGIAAGLAGAIVLARLMSSLLFGVSATDPGSFIAAVGILSFVGFAACYLPARHAAGLEPVAALQSD